MPSLVSAPTLFQSEKRSPSGRANKKKRKVLSSWGGRLGCRPHDLPREASRTPTKPLENLQQPKNVPPTGQVNKRGRSEGVEGAGAEAPKAPELRDLRTQQKLTNTAEARDSEQKLATASRRA